MADPKKRKALKQRVIFYGSLVLAITALYWYQPNRIDFIARKLPKPNPPVDPDSKHLFSAGTKVLVVTAHPDDTEFFIAGALSKLAKAGADITEVICTDGDKGYYPWENAAKNRRIRRAEQIEAGAIYPVKRVEFLGYPDGRLHPNDDVVRDIRGWIDRIQPEYILCFDGDYPPRVSHGDHRAAGTATELAAVGSSAKWLLKFSTLAPNYILDVSDEWEKQKQGLALHRSQFYGERLTGIENMVQAHAIDDGELGSFELGEGFRCVRVSGNIAR